MSFKIGTWESAFLLSGSLSSSLIIELFVFSKNQPYCSSKVSVDKEVGEQYQD